jgi:hypothetical protein
MYQQKPGKMEITLTFLNLNVQVISGVSGATRSSVECDEKILRSGGFGKLSNSLALFDFSFTRF